jgi:hypothetical protein
MHKLIYHCLLAKSEDSKNAALSAAICFAERHSHPLLPTYPLALVREPRGCLPEGMALAPKAPEHALNGATLPSRDMPKDNYQMMIIKNTMFKESAASKINIQGIGSFHFRKNFPDQWKFLQCSAATGVTYNATHPNIMHRGWGEGSRLSNDVFLLQGTSPFKDLQHLFNFHGSALPDNVLALLINSVVDCHTMPFEALSLFSLFGFW